MFYSLTLCVIGFLGLQTLGSAQVVSEEQSLCERYPQLRICALRYDLDQAIQEMAYMVRGAEQQTHMVVAHPSNEMINGKDKRKSAFVRFGKRSVGDVASEGPSGEQQPIDVLLNSRPARKSSFVRFG